MFLSNQANYNIKFLEHISHQKAINSNSLYSFFFLSNDHPGFLDKFSENSGITKNKGI